MFTQVRTPQDVFFSPQRLLVPLFQRPYVWNRDSQWLPLWQDVERVANRLLSHGNATPHFLGAVVLQQQLNETGSLATRTIIDGQQRLTTLQLLLDAIRRELKTRSLETLSTQAKNLVQNQGEYRRTDADTFKVWPTNRDREAYTQAMTDDPATRPDGVDAVGRIGEAHAFFSNQVSEWLGDSDFEKRAMALVDAVSRYMQLVVIDLQADEDAQEIFETLNARGTPLTAADLIKNFVFQRLGGDSKTAEDAYLSYWQSFETPFWEEQVSAGRLQYTRSSLFLTQWLVAQTREEITAREIFNRFKVYVNDSPEPVQKLLPKLRKSGDIYKQLMEASKAENGKLSRTELFLYRMSTLDSEVVKPVLLWLFDPEQEAVSTKQIEKALSSIESWAVRRAILRLNTKNYNRMIVDLLNLLHKSDRLAAGDAVESYLAGQSSSNSYWPSDEEVISALTSEPIYRRISRARLRMILEAIEDDRRGVGKATERFSEGPVIRGKTSIEHLLPQDWRASWQDFLFDEDEIDEMSLVHQLGNLTLVTQPLNSKVSNSPWPTKKRAFQEHTTLLMTADIIQSDEMDWSADRIISRSKSLAKRAVEIWPVPASNVGLVDGSSSSNKQRVEVADLVNSGLLRAGQTILCRVQAFAGHPAQVGEDGAIFVEGERYDSPSSAAKAVTGRQSEAGWWFWVLDLESLESLSDLRSQYIEMMELEADDSEED